MQARDDTYSIPSGGALWAGIPADHVRAVLAHTPPGGWAKVSLNKFSDSWLVDPANGAIPSGTYSSPHGVVQAWSSFAVDSKRSRLYLWGGGHATYIGNEMYVFDCMTGLWSRGSQSTRAIQFESSAYYYAPDNSAPTSSHCYSNNLYLPMSDRFMTFGGAAFADGNAFRVYDSVLDEMVVSGPWQWNPNLADPDKVGGTTGSGYTGAGPGGEMWANRRPALSGTFPGGHVNGSAAVRIEGGQEVVYVSTDSSSSGFPKLSRYVLNGVGPGEDSVATVQWGGNANQQGHAACIDTKRGWYVRVTSKRPDKNCNLGVWQLGRNNPSQPDSSSSRDFGVQLEFANSDPFDTGSTDDTEFGIAFDPVSARLFLWNANADGKVWSVEPEPNFANSTPVIWTVQEHEPVGDTYPTRRHWDAGNPSIIIGVYGKWRYAPEYKCFIAIEGYRSDDVDAPVWVYKPPVFS